MHKYSYSANSEKSAEITWRHIKRKINKVLEFVSANNQQNYSRSAI